MNAIYASVCRIHFCLLQFCSLLHIYAHQCIVADAFLQQEMSENGGAGQLMVKARFNFKQNNEDELSFSKGEMILVTRQEEGGWWEGSLNGRTGWFPSNYVREVKPCGESSLQLYVMCNVFIFVMSKCNDGVVV